jgi:hypothetical protein
MIPESYVSIEMRLFHLQTNHESVPHNIFENPKDFINRPGSSYRSIFSDNYDLSCVLIRKVWNIRKSRRSLVKCSPAISSIGVIVMKQEQMGQKHRRRCEYWRGSLRRIDHLTFPNTRVAEPAILPRGLIEEARHRRSW